MNFQNTLLKNKAGFSLVESLVAAAILTIIIIILFQGFHLGILFDSRLILKARAMRLASSNLDKAVKMLSTDFETLGGSGNFTDYVNNPNCKCDSNNLICQSVDESKKFSSIMNGRIKDVKVLVTPIVVMGDIGAKEIESRAIWYDNNNNLHPVSYSSIIYLIKKK
ncbi:MAG: prepilin-type N-terminal cleavage/methylation domain-containing protein [bacterium]